MSIYVPFIFVKILVTIAMIATGWVFLKDWLDERKKEREDELNGKMDEHS